MEITTPNFVNAQRFLKNSGNSCDYKNNPQNLVSLFYKISSNLKKNVNRAQIYEDLF